VSLVGKIKGKALKNTKVDPIMKIDETFYCSLDLSEPFASGSG